MALTPTLISGGLYKIISVASARVVTLSTADGTTVKSYRDRNVPNQMWIANNVGGQNWTLRSFYQHQGRNVYLNSSGDTRGLPVIGASSGRQWSITQWNTRGGAEYRMWFPGAPAPGTVVDLYNASDADGTVIQLWGSNDNPGQFWLFQEIPMPSTQANHEEI